MAELPRLNGVIRAWEEGKPAFTSFAQAEVETAVAMSTSKFDGVVYEMEHNFWDARALRDTCTSQKQSTVPPLRLMRPWHPKDASHGSRRTGAVMVGRGGIADASRIARLRSHFRCSCSPRFMHPPRFCVGVANLAYRPLRIVFPSHHRSKD